MILIYTAFLLNEAYGEVGQVHCKCLGITEELDDGFIIFIFKSGVFFQFLT